MSELPPAKDLEHFTPVIKTEPPDSSDYNEGPAVDDMHGFPPGNDSSAFSPDNNTTNVSEDTALKSEHITPPKSTAAPSSVPGDIVIYQQGGVGKRIEPARKHKCRYCFQTFSCEGALEFHELCHAENFPYKCSFCPKKFTNNKARDGHEEMCKKKAIFAHMNNYGNPDTSDTASLISDNSTIEMIGTPQTMDCESFDDESQSDNPLPTSSIEPTHGVKDEYPQQAPQQDQLKPVEEAASTSLEKTDHLGQTASILVTGDPSIFAIKTEPLDETYDSSSDIHPEKDIQHKISPNKSFTVATGQNEELSEQRYISSEQGTQQMNNPNNSITMREEMNHQSYQNLIQEGTTTSQISYEQGFDQSTSPTKTSRPAEIARKEINLQSFQKQGLEEFPSSQITPEQGFMSGVTEPFWAEAEQHGAQQASNNPITRNREIINDHNLGGEGERTFLSFVQKTSPAKTFQPVEENQQSSKSSINLSECRICNKSYKSFKLLRLHEESHTENRPYKCNICCVAFKKNCHLKNHAKSVHSVDGFKCNLCKRFCVNEEELKMHEAEHSCPKCGRVFSALRMLAKHMKNVACDETGKSHPNHSQVNADFTQLMGYLKSLPTTYEDKAPDVTDSNMSSQKEILPHVNISCQGDKSWPVDQQQSLPGMNTPESGSLLFSNEYPPIGIAGKNSQPESMLPESQGQTQMTPYSNETPTLPTDSSSSLIGTSPQQGHSVLTAAGTSQLHSNQCAICYQIFKSPQGLKRHSDQHFEHRPYQCTMCPLAFKRNTHLSDHMKRVHSYEGYKCSMCRAFCPSSADLIKHEALHQCSVCGIFIKTLSQVEAHKKIHIKEQSPNQTRKASDDYYVTPEGDAKQQGPSASQNECPICHKIFVTTRGLMKHSTQHTEIRPYKCHICSFGLKKNYDLAMHLKRVHGLDGFKCQFCRKFMGTKEHLAEHEALHDCSVCGSLFVNLKLMERHKHFHSEVKSVNEEGAQKQDNKSGKLLPNEGSTRKQDNTVSKISPNEETEVNCHICQTSFKSSRQLIYHLKEKHCFTAFRCGVCRKDFITEAQCKEHESTHFCSICDRKFLIMSQLEKHMEKHKIDGGVNLPGGETCGDSKKIKEKTKSGQDDESRPFQCNQCSWAFKRNTHLASHMKRVHLFNGYHCKFCRRFSQTESELVQHEATHICSDCGRGFSQARVLQQHRLLHKASASGSVNSSRPFGCQICGLSFKRNEHLKGHIRQVHSKYGFQCGQCKLFCQLDIDFKKHMAEVHQQTIDMEIGKRCKACFVYCVSDAELQQHNAKAHAKNKTHKCKICSWRFVAASQLHKHMKVHRNFQKFGCPHCPEMFNFKNKLDTHIALEHDVLLYACSVCGYTCNSQEDIYKHRITHESFKCNFCDQSFITDEEKTSHETQHVQDHATTSARKEQNQIHQQDVDKETDVVAPEGTTKCFYCHFCQSQFDTEQDLTEHMKTHLTQHTDEVVKGAVASAYSCRICGKQYKHKNTARNHERSHFQPQKYNCKNCYRRFYSEEKRDAHQSDCKPNYFRCKHCTECFKTKTKLESHEITTHTGEYLICKYCNKQFSTKVSWRMHEKLHTKEKNVICPTCGKAFHFEASLKEHIVHNHSTARPFQCMYCGLGLKTLRHLKWHERQHRGENIYKCEYCGKEFKCRTQRQVHVQNEHSGRKHVCDTCGKGFTTSTYLKQHVRIHTGEKPFKCPHCDMRFRRAHHVTQHIPRHFKGTA